jgi:hypothetical protein
MFNNLFRNDTLPQHILKKKTLKFAQITIDLQIILNFLL